MLTGQRLRFDAYMEAALYGPDGFYTGGGRAGRRGDFITSPEVGPLFGAVIAGALDAKWDEMGQPSRFDVVEVGAGPGTLARTIAVAQPRCWESLRYVAVEVSEQQRNEHPDWVTSRARLVADDDTDGRVNGVIIGNELLDNLPFRLAVYDGGWKEAFVETDGQQPVELLAPIAGGVPTVLGEQATHGARAPIIDRAREVIDAARSLLASGELWMFDYGVATTRELVGRPWRDWLRTYRGQQRGVHYLKHPGTQDITTDIPIDQLPLPLTVTNQAEWLRDHGIEKLVEEGRAAWHHATTVDLAALRMRSRIAESEALLAPNGLGGFFVATWSCLDADGLSGGG